MSSSLGHPSRYIEMLFRSVSPNKLDLQSVLSNVTSATAAASAGPLDHFYARIGALNGPFFPAGWGNLSVVNYEEDLRHLIAGPPSNIKLSWRLVERGRRNGTDYLLYEGTFRTPCLQRVFDALPPESRTGRVQLLMPARLKPFEPGSETAIPTSFSSRSFQRPYPAQEDSPCGSSTDSAGVALPRRRHSAPVDSTLDAPACVVHLAATGDQTFGRRLRLGFPLLKDNVCSLVLESPFYGARRPAAQRGSKLLRVSDLLTLGWATIAESINLMHWLREEGYGALGMCGLSMGGVHASMTAGLFPGDVAVTPLLAPRSAAVAYCDGAMRAAMAWEPLLKEVDENNNRITQVVMAAGRAVHVEVPLAGAAAAALADGGSGVSCAASGPAQTVALMRDATYALADLEVRGEKRHLDSGSEAAAPAAALSEARSEPGLVSAAAAVGGSGCGSHETAEAAVTTSGQRDTVGTQTPAGGTAGRGSRSGGAGVSVFRGLPFISVMDVQGGLARLFLRSGGDGGAASSAPPQHQQQTSSHATAPERAAAGIGRRQPVNDYTGPFSGFIHRHPRPPATITAVGAQDGHHHQHQHQLQSPEPCNQQQRPQGTSAALAAVATLPAGSHRPHSPPHQPDMPFPPASPPQQHPMHAASGVIATGPAAAPAASAAGGGVSVSVSGSSGGTAIGRRLLGDLGRAVKQLRADDRRLDRPETVLRLKQVLETYTDITRYPRPRRTDAAVIVAARDDAYVSCESVQQLHRYWHGSELRMVTGGHVSAFLMHQGVFREAIRESLARVARPPPPPLPPQA